MSDLLRPLRQALRRLRRAPAFTVVTVLTLALGIGATSAVFSVVHGVLLQPLPYDDAERLIGIRYQAPGVGEVPLGQSPALYLTYREESDLLVDTGMYADRTASVIWRREPEEVDAMLVTDGVFPLLGLSAHRGRLFSAEDDSAAAPETVVLAHDYWQRRFGGDPEVVGELLRVDGVERRIIGVMQPGVRFLDEDPALYLPFRLDRAEVFVGNFSYGALARLRPGVTVGQARDEMEAMIPIGLDRFPMPAGFSRAMLDEVGLAPVAHPLKEDVVGDVGNVLWVLLGTVGIVLLVACANVANLLLVRAEGRRQELAVRRALGASRWRLGGGVVAESLLLALAGGTLGLGLAALGLRLLRRLGPQGLPRLEEVTVDPTVLLFTVGASLLAALLFSVLPVLRLGAGRLALTLKGSGRGASEGRERNLARNLLVCAQVALALVLLIGSGLMIRSFQALRAVDPGFRAPAEVLTLRLSVPEAEAETIGDAARLHEEILRRVQSLPGVSAAGLSSSVTLDDWVSMDPIFVEDFPVAEDAVPPIRRYKWVSPEYHATMGNPLLAGRGITWADVRNRAPVAVVTENFAREFWPDPAAAVGRRIRPFPQSPWREIVGVVGDVRDAGVDEEAPAVVYWPLVVRDFFEPGEDGPRSMAYVIRSPRVGTAGFLEEVRDAIWSVNPNLPLARVRTLEALLERSMARTSFTLVMLALAAATALLLGTVGIYGVTTYAVTQRRRELGVRMALGARPADVLALVLRHGLVLAGVGAVVGLAASVGVTRLMGALLYGVGALDPLTYLAGGAVVVAVALLASFLPARRAAGIDPIETLRW